MRRRRLALLQPALAVLLVAVVTAGLLAAWSSGRLNQAICGGDCGPEHVVAPAGLRPAPAGEARADAAAASPTDLEGVLTAARSDLSADVLGDDVGLAIGSTAPGAPVLTEGDGTHVPASTTKLLTGFTALTVLDPGQRFATTAVLDGDHLVLVGGGDPYLTDRRSDDDPGVVRADLATLARQVAGRLERSGTTRVTLGYDDTLFEGPSVSPGWPSTYVRDDVVTPISPLWVDRGMVDTSQPETTPRVAEPAQDAAERFAALLRDRGIEVRGAVERTTAPAGASRLGVVRSATVGRIVEQMVRTSDDEAAEVLLRQSARAAGEPASFPGGARVVAATVRDAGIDVDGLHLDDGSGLARTNRISPTTLVEVVRAALASGRTAPVVDDLPVSGFSGTLAQRFDRAARGLVRAKTGTLTGVHSLAGVALDRDGRPVVFAVMADATDRTQPFAAQAAVDRVAAAIADCPCGS